MFNVGDEIEIVVDNGYFAFCKGSTGKITKINATSYEIVIQGSIQYLSKGDEHHIKLITKPSFQAGDKVYYTGQDARYCGVEFEVTSANPSGFVVAHSTSMVNSILFDPKDLVKAPPTPSTQSQTQQHTFGSSWPAAARATLNAAQQFYTGGSWTLNEPGKIEYNATKEAGCQHEWRDYIGLSKRMDICTKCPASKNERGIYE